MRLAPRVPRPRLRAAVAAAATLSAAAGVLTVTSGEESAATVTVNQVYSVPDGGTFTVRGRGFGHGNGMSQYGAQGAALQGRSAQQILDFYYPGTVKTIAKSQRIRVLISADTTDAVEVRMRSGLRVRDLGARKSYVLPTGVNADTWRLRTGPGNSNVVEYYRNGWRAWQPGGKATLAGVGEFFSPDGPVTLVLPSGQIAYRGALRAASPTPTTTARNTVNVVPLDDYVKGVIPAEMPPSWNKYALRAQAVAARTYAAFDREARHDGYYQTCDTTACQVYKGTSAEQASTNAAAQFTAGQIRTFQGKPAFTQFSASNGGWTSAGSFSYSVSKRDPYDGWSGNSYRAWSVRLTAKRISDAYPAIGRLLRVRVTKREGGGEWKGRVETIVLEGTKAKRTLSGDAFRSHFGLKSTWFRL